MPPAVSDVETSLVAFLSLCTPTDVRYQLSSFGMAASIPNSKGCGPTPTEISSVGINLTPGLEG